MPSDFSDLRAEVSTIMDENGVSATLRRRSETVADSAKPWRSGTSTSTDYTATMVFVPAGANDSYVDASGTTHQAEIKILIAGNDLAVTPNLKDVVVNGSDVWTLVNAKTVAPNNEVIVHVLLGVK